jgi:Uma2 family endonuclease
MPSAVQIGLSEYIETTYHPDCEYIDGKVRERNVGKWQHARLQWISAMWFGHHEAAWNLVGSTEQRVRVSPTRIRIPDLVVLRPGAQPELLIQPPLLVIEILSPDDTYSDLQERCQDYLQMGVQTIWIVDPKTGSGRLCSGQQWVAAERLVVAGTPLHVHLDPLFAQISSESDVQA